MLLLLEPLMYLIIAIAEEYEIEPIYGMDNDIGDEKITISSWTKTKTKIKKIVFQTRISR